MILWVPKLDLELSQSKPRPRLTQFQRALNLIRSKILRAKRWTRLSREALGKIRRKTHQMMEMAWLRSSQHMEESQGCTWNSTRTSQKSRLFPFPKWQKHTQTNLFSRVKIAWHLQKIMQKTPKEPKSSMKSTQRELKQAQRFKDRKRSNALKAIKVSPLKQRVNLKKKTLSPRQIKHQHQPSQRLERSCLVRWPASSKLW